MRHPGDSTAGRSASRPRDPASGQTSGRRGRAAGSPPPARGPRAGGPRTARPAPGRTATSQSSCRATAASGRAARRAAGPAGGTGRRMAGPGAGRRVGPGSDPGGSRRPRGSRRRCTRPASSRPGTVRTARSRWPTRTRPGPRRRPATGARNGYGLADDALAVSEPSADVTATGTWRTYSDAPGDGTWGQPRGGVAAQVPQQAPPPAGELARDGLDAAAVAGSWPPGTGPGRAGGGAPTVVPPTGSTAAAFAAGAGAELWPGRIRGRPLVWTEKARRAGAPRRGARPPRAPRPGARRRDDRASCWRSAR